MPILSSTSTQVMKFITWLISCLECMCTVTGRESRIIWKFSSGMSLWWFSWSLSLRRPTSLIWEWVIQPITSNSSLWKRIPINFKWKKSEKNSSVSTYSSSVLSSSPISFSKSETSLKFLKISSQIKNFSNLSSCPWKCSATLKNFSFSSM